MDWIFWTGVFGSLLCVLGAALPEAQTTVAYRSPKNLFLALGALVMWVYTLLGFWYQEATVFFIFLETLVVCAAVLMLCSVSERRAGSVLMVGGLGFVGWSLVLAQSMDTVWFIAGLTLISLGYVLQAGSSLRYLTLTLGSALVAYFSYLSSSWVFFWLNAIFAGFSLWYLLRALRSRN